MPRIALKIALDSSRLSILLCRSYFPFVTVLISRSSSCLQHLSVETPLHPNMENMPLPPVQPSAASGPHMPHSPPAAALKFVKDSPARLGGRAEHGKLPKFLLVEINEYGYFVLF